MRRRILKQAAIAALITSFTINTYAVAPGLYLGLMAGPATNGGSAQQAQTTALTTTTPATPSAQQFGSRIFMGYKVNQYAGVEGGLTYMSGINYDSHDVPTCGGTTARVRDFDLVGKGTFPILSAFDVFGKAGVALVYQTQSGALNPTTSPTSAPGVTPPVYACGSSQYNTHFRPTFSFGASYDLSQSWVLDISANRIMTSGTLNYVDIYALGISYHFVDVYCGQFLCA